jgi:hypothetical protein
MRLRAILIFVAAVAVAAAGAAAVAGANATSTRPSGRVLVFLAPPGGTTTPLDFGKHGPSAGDEFVTADSPLEAAASHTRVGRIDGIETVISAARSELSLNAQTGAGTLEVEGVFDPNQPSFTLPVVGGTGAYTGVRGTVTLRPGGTPTLTFHLLA